MNNRANYRVRATLALLLAATCTACATQRVEPWQRGTLARAEMQFDVDPLTSAYRQHTQFSKEAANGGAALAGGGCGCN